MSGGSFRKRFEDNFALGVLGVLLAGFVAGIGAYRGLLAIYNADTVPKGTYILKDDLKTTYISKDDLNDLYVPKNTHEKLLSDYNASQVHKTKTDAVRSDDNKEPLRDLSKNPFDLDDYLLDPQTKKWAIVYYQDIQQFSDNPGGRVRELENVIYRVKARRQLLIDNDIKNVAIYN